MNPEPKVTVEDIEMSVDALDVKKAADIFEEHGCLVVRGLMAPYIKAIHQDIEAAAAESLSLLDEAEQIVEGWRTPNGTLFIPAPSGYTRDQQIMVLAVNYQTSAAFFQSAFDDTTADIVEAILGPNVEIYGNGQCLYKEPVGGHPKHLHQDSAYFEHRYQGPVGILNYVVDTDLVNGHYTSYQVRTNWVNSNILTHSRISVWRKTNGPGKAPSLSLAMRVIQSSLMSRPSTVLNRTCPTNRVRFSSTVTVERMTMSSSVGRQQQIGQRQKNAPPKPRKRKRQQVIEA